MTQLCAIPRCRIRGRHLPGCDEDNCGGCLPRTTDEGYVCDVDADRTLGWLAAIIELAPDARLVAAGLVRRGAAGGSGKPASRPPLNDGATDAVDAVQNALTTIARDIAETRGAQFASTAFDGRRVLDPIIEAAKWLTRQIGWVRHAVDDQGEPYAVTVFAEIRDAHSRMRRVVNGPADQKFLGPCGCTVTWDDEGHEIQRAAPCDGDVYGHPEAEKGTCRKCGARWATTERTAWLDGEVRDHAFRAAHIAEAYGVSADTIRSWAARGNLRSYWITDAGLTVEWTDPPIDDDLTGEERERREAEIAEELAKRGPRVHYIGDVLDLAAAAAARRESERAKRARRAAARESAEMGA